MVYKVLFLEFFFLEVWWEGLVWFCGFWEGGISGSRFGIGVVFCFVCVAGFSVSRLWGGGGRVVSSERGIMVC